MLPASPLDGNRERRRHIVCLGDLMIDIVAELPGPLVLGSDVHAPIRYLPGGSAANTASWLSVSGAPVTLIGRVGDDPAGRQLHLELSETGIIDRLQTDPVRPTGTCIVLVGPDGERTMVPDPGANGSLDPAELDAEDFTADGHLHVSGYALLGGARPAALAALALAREAQMTISIDAASAGPLAALGAPAFTDSIGGELLLFANAAEARVLTDDDSPGSAARELAARFGFAVVKAGADGAYWSDRTGTVLHQAAARLAHVTDTTGAGDAFAATFLSTLSAGLGPARALRHATRIATLSCGNLGGRPSADARANPGGLDEDR